MAKFKNRFFNRSQISAPVLLSLIILGFGWIGISHLSKSDAAPAGYLCASFGSGQCASLASGGIANSGAAIGVNNAEHAWRWYEVPKYTVTASGPFSTGRMNDFYRGKPVVQFQMKSNTDYCMTANEPYVVLSRCTDTESQLWVISGNRVVNVASSDNQGAAFGMTEVNSQVKIEREAAYPVNSQNWGWITDITN